MEDDEINAEQKFQKSITHKIKSNKVKVKACSKQAFLLTTFPHHFLRV